VPATGTLGYRTQHSGPSQSLGLFAGFLFAPPILHSSGVRLVKMGVYIFSTRLSARVRVRRGSKEVITYIVEVSFHVQQR
jgi:hypothetical protein